MSTIYEEIHSLSPNMEDIHSQFIVQKYAKNDGDGETSTTKYFSQLWQPFAWAAILGFYHDKRITLKGTKTSHFKFDVINNNATDIFNALILFAVAKEGYEILKNASNLKTVIEEYANGGFQIISTTLKDKGSDYYGFESSYLEEVMSRKELKIITKNNILMRDDTDISPKVSTGTEFEI